LPEGIGGFKMELIEYFNQRNTPAAGSPTGLAMIELMKMDSNITV
jgi:hypothetical protein